MNNRRMGALGVLSAWSIVVVVGATATIIWVRRVWKNRRELPVSTRAVAGVVATSAIFAAFGTAVGMLKAFGAVGGESIDPSQKARVLAAGISEAMNCTALGLLAWLPSVIALAVLLRKHPTATR